MSGNLKALIGRLDDACRDALERAAALCLARTNYEVDVEHYLLKLTEGSDSDIARALHHFGADASRLSSDLTRALDRLKTGNARTPSLSPRLVRLIEEAWMLASIDYGAARVSSAHLLLALLADEDLGRLAREVSEELKVVSVEALRKQLPSLAGAPGEGAAPRAYDESGGDGAQGTGGDTSALGRFTVDLTAAAREGRIDPVLERDFEIRQIVDILTRRRQNNPILTGEAGVGKTALVEGFALRVAAGDVPEPLRHVSVRALDLGLLQAGAGVKGEFENRLKGVIEGVKSSPVPVILFIDEAHTLIGAGGAAGASDAANLLKPALARGELRTIAATTWAEYKKYFEKDAALARRFQVVKVEEPTEEQCVRMMRGLVPMLERHHGVRVLEEAVKDAVQMSHRYISGRQLPDKAISVLDTACARVAISQAATPPAVEDSRRRIDRLTSEVAALEREEAAGASHRARIESLLAEREEEEQRRERLEEQWKSECELIAQMREMRASLEGGAGGNGTKPANSQDEKDEGVAVAEEAGADGHEGRKAKKQSKSSKKQEPEGDGKNQKEADPVEMRAKLARLGAKLRQVQGETPLAQVCVDSQTCAEVISGWTGIPVGRMLTDEINTVLTLKERLEQRVVGQSHALEAITQRIATSRANLTDPRRPVGVFLLVGPSRRRQDRDGARARRGALRRRAKPHQHKHERVSGGAHHLFAQGLAARLRRLRRGRRVDRSSPAQALLRRAARRSGEGHSDVMELFYQVFDKGVLEDSEGREIDFRNTVIILTSNVASETIIEVCSEPDSVPEPEVIGDLIRPELLRVFKPALLGRMAVVPYYPVSTK